MSGVQQIHVNWYVPYKRTGHCVIIELGMVLELLCSLLMA
jgi:hypothetical protein